ncbi:MAG: DUF4159 domain-containing protein [Gammaproteobacteria bacterium]
MSRRSQWTLLLTLAALLAAGTALAEREWRVYKSFEAEADDSPVPPDYDKPAGFVVARLMYPSGGFRGGYGDWRQGGTSWAVDYPRGDRYFASILRRLTTIDVRSVEQPVNLEDGDDVFDWPYLIVGLAGYWNLDDDMVKKLREYLLRGGFLLADSYFGSDQWAGFTEGMRRVFPDREIVDLPDDHPLFHTVYDLDGKHMVPHFDEWSGRAGYLGDGNTPHWRAILDDDGRVMVAIAFNNDLGDSYQWADDPRYPAESASLGLRMGVNFVVYALTH